MIHHLKSALAALAIVLSGSAAFAADYTIMAPAAPGGGWDQNRPRAHSRQVG